MNLQSATFHSFNIDTAAPQGEGFPFRSVTLLSIEKKDCKRAEGAMKQEKRTQSSGGTRQTRKMVMEEEKCKKTHHRRPVLRRRLRPRNQESHHHVTAHAITSGRLVVAPPMMHLLVAVQPLTCATRVALERHAARQNGVECVLMPVIIVPAVRRLGQEVRCQSRDQRVHQPVVAGRR